MCVWDDAGLGVAVDVAVDVAVYVAVFVVVGVATAVPACDMAIGVGKTHSSMVLEVRGDARMSEWHMRNISTVVLGCPEICVLY